MMPWHMHKYKIFFEITIFMIAMLWPELYMDFLVVLRAFKHGMKARWLQVPSLGCPASAPAPFTDWKILGRAWVEVIPSSANPCGCHAWLLSQRPHRNCLKQKSLHLNESETVPLPSRAFDSIQFRTITIKTHLIRMTLINFCSLNFQRING